jgi:hypothetical protein
MDLKLDGKTSNDVSSGSIQGQGAGSCEEVHLDFRVHKMRFRDYQLLKKDSVPWSQSVCYGGWVGYLLHGIMRQRPQVVVCKSVINSPWSAFGPPKLFLRPERVFEHI